MHFKKADFFRMQHYQCLAEMCTDRTEPMQANIIILKLGDRITLRTVCKDFVVSASEQRDVEVGGGDGNRGDTRVRQCPH